MQNFDELGIFYLGRNYDLRSKSQMEDFLLYDSKDLVTHAICIGMTGSGKTGLCISLIEEAAIDSIPTIAIDPKGDLTNLLLTFPELRSDDFIPWINEEEALKKGLTKEQFAEQQASLWKNGLAKWGQDGKRIQRLRECVDFMIFTPGSNSGLPISILKSFAAPSATIRDDNELLQERITTTVTSLLGLLSIEADPITSREHILISNILASSWQSGVDLDIGRLIELIQTPPMSRIGILDVESFYPSKDRFELALKLNNILASPGFKLWLEGEPLDISGLLHSPNGKPRVSIIYIAHLNDAQRMFFVSLLLNQIVGWMRSQSGTSSLRSILYIDEVFGYLPPLFNPPSKLPLLTLLKQARAFGLGVVLSTQNPVDLDYKAISNAGTWFLGRLQTERDKARVMDGLESASVWGQNQFDRKNIDQILSSLGNRIFLMNNVHEDTPIIFETRWAMSYLRGPLTREQIKILTEPMKIEYKYKFLNEPETTQPSIPINISTSSKIKSNKPLIIPDIPQYFIPKNQNQLNNSTVIYHPFIIGEAQVRFTNTKTKFDLIQNLMFITPVTNDPITVNWDNSNQTNIKISDLQKTAIENVLYSDLPSAALKKNNYNIWKSDFINWLTRTQKIKLLKSKNLNEISSVGENERDFIIRLQQIAREKRDQQVNKIMEKYSIKFAKINNRLRRAQMNAEEYEAQAIDQKYQTAISLGTTLLGGFLGRRTRNYATRTSREMSRIRKKKKQSEDAKENYQAIIREKILLEEQFKNDVNMLDAKINPDSEDLESILIYPSKANISVRFIALIWGSV